MYGPRVRWVGLSLNRCGFFVQIAAVLSGWKEAYKDSEMTEAAGRINTHVANRVTAFLRLNGFTHDGRTVTAKQLCILGIPTI